MTLFNRTCKRFIAEICNASVFIKKLMLFKIQNKHSWIPACKTVTLLRKIESCLGYLCKQKVAQKTLTGLLLIALM